MANKNSEIVKNYILAPLDTTTDALNGRRGSQILLMVLQRILHPWRIWRSWTLWWTSLSFNYDRVRGHASRVSFRLTSAPVPAFLSELTRRRRWVYDEGKLYRQQPHAKHTYYSRKGLQIAVLQTQCGIKEINLNSKMHSFSSFFKYCLMKLVVVIKIFFFRDQWNYCQY